MNKIDFIEVSEENVKTEGLFCLKNPKNPGFGLKIDWLIKRRNEGLKLKLLKINGETAGFIEYVPAEYAWRPVKAEGYLFIHCLWVYPKEFYKQGFASRLIDHSFEDAEKQGLNGVVVMVSDGSWMASREVFVRNGFVEVDKKERFELLVKKIRDVPNPGFANWELERLKYSGLNLILAHQCPLFIKSVDEMKKTALELGYELNAVVLNSAGEAQKAPSGYGVYSLLYNDRLLADHYVSNTRFKNILTKEL